MAAPIIDECGACGDYLLADVEHDCPVLGTKVLSSTVLAKEFDPNQPRDSHGRWSDAPGRGGPGLNIAELYGDHKGTPEDPVPCGADIERAALVIGDGGHVTLDQPDQVATLLDELRKMVKEAEAKGEKAPVYDLCNVSVPGTNLFCQDSVKRPDGTTIERVQMPQLSTKDPVPGSYADKQPRNAKGEVDLGPDFAKFLESSGYALTPKTIDASHLRASQAELNGGKVAGIAGAIADGKIDPSDPKNAIYVTRDNYVIDGHHRWAANVGESLRTGKQLNMPVIEVDADIGTALTVANFWSEEMGIPAADAAKKSRRDAELAIKAAELGIAVPIPEQKDASALIRWFNAGADGAIPWGSPGDWAACVAVASAHMGVEDAHGFCQRRHIDATGMSTAEHAHNGKAFDESEHPRDHRGRFAEVPGGGNPLVGPLGESGSTRSSPSGEASSFVAEPSPRLTALRGRFDAWQRDGIFEMSAAQLEARDDPTLRIKDTGDSIAGMGRVAARWQGEYVEVTPSLWDEDDPDGRRWLISHETSHAAAADILANMNKQERDDMLRPFRNTENGHTYSESALVFPGEYDSMARGPEEMMADVGATLLIYGRDVLQQRFEDQRQYDISPDPPDPRLVRLYNAVAASLDRVGNPPKSRGEKRFDPSQPRDSEGRWAETGTGSDLSLKGEDDLIPNPSGPGPSPHGPVSGTVYHGGFSDGDPDVMFMTNDRDAGEWYAIEHGDQLETWHLAMENPANEEDLRQVVADLGTPPEAIEANSPYTAGDDNPNDYIYVPEVQEALHERGFDGLRAWDVIENYEVQIFVPIGPADAGLGDIYGQQLRPIDSIPSQRIIDKNEEEIRAATEAWRATHPKFDEHLHPRDDHGEGRPVMPGPLKRFDPSQLRDELGRWTDEGSGGGGGADPAGHIKFTLGTLHDEDAAKVESTIRHLSAKYPGVAQEVASVQAATLKTRWGSFDNANGKMKVTNIGKKYGEEYRDPRIAQTAAHEFGHAMILHLAGGFHGGPKPPSVRRQWEQGVDLIDAREQVARYNDAVNDVSRRKQDVVTDAYRRLKSVLDNNRGSDIANTYRLIETEFADNPEYYASDDEELLAAAFAHWETGEHGLIADTVGPYLESLYRAQSQEAAA